MTIAMLLGVGFGLGALLIAAGLSPAPVPLTDALARLHESPDIPVSSAPWKVRLFGESWQSSALARRLLAGTEADLRLCDITPAQHLTQRLLFATIGALWAPATAALMIAGGISIPWVIPAWVSVALFPIGFLFPTYSLRTAAASRRRSFRHAFSSFLDIVSVSLASGRGVEGALNDAANSGGGWAFDHLRRALRQARFLGETPWHSLGRLGAELKITELQELAASAELAGAEGARVRASIAAKARALRLRGLTDVEAEAQSANERMSLPIVGLMVGFVVFLGYPAVIQVVNGL